MTRRGWSLDTSDRHALLGMFPPAWPDVIADHVTFGGSNDEALPEATAVHVIGLINDGLGLEVLIVKIDGNSRRPDGRTYHITWSIDRALGRKPFDSNVVIERYGWASLDQPVQISLNPTGL